MADTKVSALTALIGTGVDTANDVLPIVDTSVTTTKKILIDELRIALLSNTALTNSIAGDVTVVTGNTYYTGPTVVQGTVGTWYASGTVTCLDTSGATTFIAKLWDGTTVIDSASIASLGANNQVSISLSGMLASPAGNIRISVTTANSGSSLIKANVTGNSKDSTVTAFRIG